MSEARDYIGNPISLNMGGTANVGQLTFEEPSPMPSWLPVGGELTQYIAGIIYPDETPGGMPAGCGSWQYGTSKPNSLNLLRYVSAAGNMSTITDTTYNNLAAILGLGEQNYNANHTDTWSDFLIRAQSNIAWLWGSLRDGGCGMVKVNNTQVCFISTYGVYDNAARNDERIAATQSINHTYADFANECVMAVYYNKQSDSYGGWIDLICPTGNQCTFYSGPREHLFWPVMGIAWDVNYGGIGATLNNGITTFGTGSVPNIIINLNSIRSPYTSEIQIYKPGTTIVMEGYTLVEGSDDVGLGENQYDRGGDAGDKSGNGDYDLSSDDVDGIDDNMFTVDAQSCGFVTVYKPGKTVLQDFAAWLYGTLPTSYGAFLDQIKKLQLNPMDGIISLNISHFSAPTSGSESIGFYGQDSGYSAPIVTKLTHVKDCGTVDVSELISGWLSYNDNVKLKAYIPYCGTFDLSTNLLMAGKLRLKYAIDVLTGACVAEIEAERASRNGIEEDSYKAPLYRFTGNVFQQIPISAVDYSGIIQGQLGLAAGAASIASGNVIGGVNAAFNAMTAHPTVSTIGNAGATYGYMSDQVPFLMYEFPCYNMPEQYAAYYGEPIYDFKIIGNCRGLIFIDQNTFWATDPDGNDFIDMTAEEEELLKQAVAEGLYMPRTNEDMQRKNYDPTA